jgi:hypothetical protein
VAALLDVALEPLATAIDARVLCAALELIADVVEYDALLLLRAAASPVTTADARDALLLRIVYPLLDMLAHGDGEVARAAGAALRRVALCVLAPAAERTVALLVRANADYVIDCACRSLQRELVVPLSTARV